MASKRAEPPRKVPPNRTRGRRVNTSKMVDLFRTIWTGMYTHKLRSFLTILGVVIGVAAVIALPSIGVGTQQSILSWL